MAQQGKSKFPIVPVPIVYMLFFAWWQFFGPKPKPEPAQTQSVLAQAQAEDAEGRKADPNMARTDQIKKLQDAAKKYEEYYGDNKHTPEGIQARFDEVNIFDFLAHLSKDAADTQWYDQAESKLKDMAASLMGKTGTVTVETAAREGAGNSTPLPGLVGTVAVVNDNKLNLPPDGEWVQCSNVDLGAVSSELLKNIRVDRDNVYRGQLWHRVLGINVYNGKVLYQILSVLVQATGSHPNFSYFLALALVVIVLKGATFPFQRKQYQYQKDMQRIQPLIKQMQEEMKGRPADEIQKRQMQIFKENNVNIAGGCLPMLVMVVAIWPVFYMVRDYEYQFSHAHFLWVGSSLSLHYSWIAKNLAEFDLPLFVIYLATTMAYSALQPKPVDEQQAKQQQMMTYMMPLMFGAMMWFYRWSSAFMLYWLILNLVSMYQSWKLNKEVSVASSGGANSGGANSGGTAAAVTPLTPMKAMAPKVVPPGRNGTSTVPPNRVRPRRSSDRK